MTKIQDRALFCEYLPNTLLVGNGKKHTRSEGTLLLIFESGSVCCYPINDKTLRSISEYAVALSTESTLKPRNKSKIEYSSIDAQLPRKDLVKIDVLKFPKRTNGTPIHPRKIALSPNKKFLLIIGVEYSKQRRLIVYKILSNSKDPLQPIFYDRSLAYFDACFSSDSKNLIALPSRFPGFVFMFKLPKPQNLWNNLYFHDSSEFVPISSRSRFTPRSCGPLFVIGPAKNSFGKPLEMTHISGSVNSKLHTFSTQKKPQKTTTTHKQNKNKNKQEIKGKNEKQKQETREELKESKEEKEEEVEVEQRSESDFVTWNDLGYGEYCLWSLKSAKYVYKNYSFLEKKFVNKDKLNIEKQFEEIYDDSDDSECYYEDNSSEDYYYSSTESSDELNKLKWNDNRNDWSLDDEDDDDDDDDENDDEEYDEYSFEYSDQVSEIEDLQITESTKKETNINNNKKLDNTTIKNNSLRSETQKNENENKNNENPQKNEEAIPQTEPKNQKEINDELVHSKQFKENKTLGEKEESHKEEHKNYTNTKNNNRISNNNNKNAVENENGNINNNNENEKLNINNNQVEKHEDESEEWDDGDDDGDSDGGDDGGDGEESDEVEDNRFLNNQRRGRRKERKGNKRDGFYFYKNFEYFPRILFPSVHKTDQINEKTQPTAYILDMKFSPPSYSIINEGYDGDDEEDETEKEITFPIENKYENTKLLAVIIRHSFRNSSDNGIGISMVDGSVPKRQDIDDPEEIKKNQRMQTKKGSESSLKSSIELKDLGNHLKVMYHKSMNQKNAIWYRASESSDRNDLLCSKWTNTMLIGQAPSASIVLRGKGVYELVDYSYGSEFQALYSYFVKNVVNFVTVTSYHRFWLTKTGELRLIIVNPTVPSLHPEWKHIFNTSGNQKMDNYLYRQIGRRVGYYINKIEDKLSDTRGGRTKGGRSKGRRGGKQYNSNNNDNKRVFGGFGLCESCVGLHLYRCFFCGTLLTRPLQCGMTLSAVYCSKECQANHWKTWKMRITHHELKK
ncbi:hypothetical protein M0812_06652 [Anaeramoeba flamelloides]|uniref:MYND-type domain-containing protein n=1 Tax=Anaeramoeba flamelloides TaxID=1746091 RepID=A0AAV8ACF7_9EUKA|nr:hypothetical protein M0812_06652 [Anaeramoeba flamelloides]